MSLKKNIICSFCVQSGKFYTWHDIFTRAPPVVPVTIIRYAKVILVQKVQNVIAGETPFQCHISTLARLQGCKIDMLSLSSQKGSIQEQVKTKTTSRRVCACMHWKLDGFVRQFLHGTDQKGQAYNVNNTARQLPACRVRWKWGDWHPGVPWPSSPACIAKG